MKKLLLTFLFAVMAISVGKTAFAATPSSTPTAAVSTTEEQINNLKDRIASRVAQLNLVDKRGFIGTVTDISETQITLNDMSGTSRIVDVDELTKFSSPSAKTSFGISDITKGATVGVIGLYNKDSRRLLARFVDVLELPRIYSGGILTIDNDTYTFTIATTDNQTVDIDVENITKTTSYTRAGGMVKAGFSRLSVGQRVQIVGYPDVKNNKLIIASRILLFPDLPVNPKITLINPSDIVPVSTGSGKKIQPIVK